ncbi:GNAT family N-acetyltransferase [Vagococcus luciliae]|uniref:N-acetyltransferase domain-containing protein n=1 Tax=Vagococcus luciliae TaxID=2920380 RepID=A0ABY5NWX6_9ENTE|nr:GNAT family protein [Vagococcus luciliae]UUV98094.1 hypothetical protein G314FT_01850 [Vagococcus luciliae]
MTEFNITLRQAIPSDATHLINAISLLNQETPYLVVSPHALNMSPDTMAHEIDYIYNAPNQFILLALNHDDIIGVATIVSDDDSAFQHVGELGITIKKEFWGLGLGTAMIEELIQLCLDYEVTKRIEINVQTRNHRALHLYNKMGFYLEGIKRKAFLSENNQFIDIAILSYLLI